MGVDWLKLRSAIAKAAREVFDGYRKKSGGDSFYAFALHSDDGADTICPAANTKESHRRRVAEYGYTDAVDIYGIRWNPEEWPYSGDEHRVFLEASELMSGDDRYDDDSEAAFVRFKGKLFATMVQGLADLVDAGYFGTGASRERVVVYCSVSDSLCSAWLEHDSARRLNPPAIFQAFAKESEVGRPGDLARSTIERADTLRAYLQHFNA